ncbi:MAG TPA: amidohydrolase family protein [Candidatus Binatia bacterium]|nr:amidohydrolase family protein [Candidatus Binatia bacterium]
MRVIDADGHVEENPLTFSDKYLDPAFRAHRPQVVPGTEDGLAYWMIDEQLFPRRVGRGCNNLGTPASINGKPVRHAQRKPDSLGSMELTNLKERLQIMDEENIWLQVLYPTLFLAYPLSSNAAYASAMYSAYNRWLGDVLAGQERLKWVGVANLDDIPAAVQEVQEAKQLGAVGMMILGTAGDRLLDDESLLPFYDAVASADLPLAVHVGWACPALNNLYTHIYPSGVIPFLMPVLMGMVSMMSGGIFDRYPDLRVVYLEAGCLWVHFILERLHHRFEHSGKNLSNVVSRTAPIQKLAPMDYIKKGNIYFSAEVEDVLLPQVLELVGDGQLMFASDMPHGDRERFAAKTLQERRDISAAAKTKILESNPAKFYRLDGF